MSASPEEEAPVDGSVVDAMRDAHALLDAFGPHPPELGQSVRVVDYSYPDEIFDGATSSAR